MPFQKSSVKPPKRRYTVPGTEAPPPQQYGPGPQPPPPPMPPMPGAPPPPPAPPPPQQFTPAPGFAGPSKPDTYVAPQMGPRQKGMTLGDTPGQVGMYGQYQLAGRIDPWGNLLKSNWTVDPQSGRILPFSGGWGKGDTGSVRTGVYKPDYEPSFWENPYNVARAYWQLQSLPPGAEPPVGMDRAQVEAAYKYLEFMNRDESGQPVPWVQWKYLNTQDPGRGYLQSIEIPGPEYLLPAANYQEMRFYEEQTKPPAERDGRGLPPVYQYYMQQQQYYDQIINSPEVAPDPNRPAWMKFVEGLQSPSFVEKWGLGPEWTEGLQAGISGGINLGALGLILGGPGGALAGAGTGALLGGLSTMAPESGWGVFEAYRRGVGPGAKATIGWSAQQVLSLFNVPASFLEEGLGVGLQFAAAAYDPKAYGSVEEVWKAMSTPSGAQAIDWTTGRTNVFGQAGLAAQATYESGVLQQVLRFGSLQQILGVEDKYGNFLDPGNIMSALEYFVRAKMLGEDIDLVQANNNQVWMPGRAEPVTVDAIGVAALVEARRRLANGEDPNYVSFDTMTRFGLTGQFWDLMGSIVLDPLNVAPQASSGALARVGHWVGDPAMEIAFRTAAETGKGPVSGFRRYVAAIRHGLAGPADQLTGFQRMVSGMNETGQIRAWTDYTPTNPIHRAFAHIFAMTPEARMREFVASMADASAVAFDMYRGDPDAMVGFIERFSSMSPTEAANLGQMFGSPEMYSGKQAYGTYLQQARLQLDQWHAGDGQRAAVNNLAQVLGETPGDFLTRLEDMKDAPAVLRWIMTTLQDVDTPAAKAIMRDITAGVLNPQALVDIGKTFLGDNAVPLHPAEFQARLWDGMTTNAAEWAAKAFNVQPSPGAIRFFDTLKKAQTGILLGWNPAYFVNNTVNNAVSMVSTGVFGTADAKTIGRYIDRLGVEPYRMHAGAGIADLGLETGKGGAENVVRAATVQPGKLTDLNRVLDQANKWAPFSAASRHVERASRVQAMYQGIHQAMDGLWQRGRGFREMPQGLRSALAAIAPRLPEILYRSVEGSLNKTELRAKLEGLAGATARYEVSQHLPDVARQLGIDPVLARDTLRPVMDDLEAQLATAKTTADVRNAFRNVEQRFQRHVDEMVARDLRTRAEQVGAQVQTGGMAEAVRIFDDLNAKMDEFWSQHWFEWDETFKKAAEVRKLGGKADAFYRKRNFDANQQWARYRNFERASLLGVLDGMKFADDASKQYIGLVDANHKLWGDFFTAKEARFQQFQDTKFANGIEREAAWAAMKRELDGMYNTTRGQINVHNGQIGGIFVEHVREQFGDAAAAYAEKWRGRMTLLDVERGRMIDEFRRSTEGMDFGERRQAWQAFLENEHKPHIAEFFKAEVEGVHELYRNVTGGDPPGTAPPVPPRAPEGGAQFRMPEVDQTLRERTAAEITQTQDFRALQAEAAKIRAERRAEVIATEKAAAERKPMTELPRSDRLHYEDMAPFLRAVVETIETTPEHRNFVKITDEATGLTTREGTYPDWWKETFRAFPTYKGLNGKFAVLAALDEIIAGNEPIKKNGQVPEIVFRLREVMDNAAFMTEHTELGAYPDEVYARSDFARALELVAEGKMAEAGAIVAPHIDAGRLDDALAKELGLTDEQVGDLMSAYGQADNQYSSTLPETVETAVETVQTAEQAMAEAQAQMQALITDIGYDKTSGLKVYYPGQSGPAAPFNNLIDGAKALVALDMVGLKALNDGFGHGAGDAFIAAVGEASRQSGVEVIRSGKRGDEFFIPAETIEQAAQFRDTIITELKNTVFVFETVDGKLYAATGFQSRGGVGNNVAEADAAANAVQIPGYTRGQGLPPGAAVTELNPAWIETEGVRLTEQSTIPGTNPPVAGQARRGFIDPAAWQQIQSRIADLDGLAADLQNLTNEYAQAHHGPTLDDFGPKPPEEGQPATTPAVGPYMPGLAENITGPRFDGMIMSEGWENYTRPLLSTLEERMLASGNAAPIGGVPPELMGQVNTWLDGVGGDMATAKRAAVAWGEKLGDEALLNYSQRRGFDQYLNMVFPYQFWFTRTAWNWALRMIDRPAWFANWARMRNFFASRPRSGMPSRMQNKMAIPIPFLPSWTGGQVWVDPMRKLFPFEEMTTPIDSIMADKNEDEQRAQTILAQMVSSGQLSQQEAYAAASSRAGPVWQRALASAQQQMDEGQSNPMDFLSLVMAPALWVTLPYFALTGKTLTGETDMPLLPITRTGQAIQAVTQNTPIEALGNLLGGILAAPEGAIRKVAGLQEFGAWGDYYVDRMLANMAADGTFPTRDITMAMIERQGPAFDEARRRAQLEMALRTPGALPAYGLLHGAAWNDPVGMAAGTLFGWLPGGLLPTGEMEQRGLAEQWKTAWTSYNHGNTDALNNFMTEHPEYEARLALYDEPEERLRQFLISEVWDRYTEMGSAEKQQARAVLGDQFLTDFLDDDTRSYDTLDIDTLATWTQLLGGDVPETEATAGALDPDINPAIQYAPPEVNAEVNTYRDLRTEQFPNWYALQSTYFTLPEGQRQGFLQQFPELEQYWDWNRGYKAEHPAVEQFTTSMQAQADQGQQIDYSFFQDFSPATMSGLIGWVYAGQALGAGARADMQMVWEDAGKPGGDFETFLSEIVYGALAP